jgi:hypothetical protein
MNILELMQKIMKVYIPKEFPEENSYTFQVSPAVRSSLETPNFPHIFCSINGNRYVS